MGTNISSCTTRALTLTRIRGDMRWTERERRIRMPIEPLDRFQCFQCFLPAIIISVIYHFHNFFSHFMFSFDFYDFLSLNCKEIVWIWWRRIGSKRKRLRDSEWGGCTLHSCHLRFYDGIGDARREEVSASNEWSRFNDYFSIWPIRINVSFTNINTSKRIACIGREYYKKCLWHGLDRETATVVADAFQWQNGSIAFVFVFCWTE